MYDHLKGRLRFKDITTFNDPFEAKPRHVAAFQDAAAQRAAMVRYLAEIAPIQGSMTARRRWAAARIAGKGQQEIIELIADSIAEKDQSGEMFVFCLMAPEVVATPLPWSHYADSHRGVCLHFDSSVLPIKLAFAVEYSDEYPTVKVPRTEQTDWTGVKSMLLRKSKMWSYEQEHRVFQLKYADGTSLNLFRQWEGDVAIAPSRVCTAITLGCRMEQPVRERLAHWVRNNTPHVEVWQARQHRSRYELERERVI
ncbi:MAG: DUF2971 domain-containing protein [Gammaproteobacteria bacterium]